ncbi:hypothetical protein H1C71_028651, partial [Ictidomys tridecemlineatus]
PSRVPGLEPGFGCSLSCATCWAGVWAISSLKSIVQAWTWVFPMVGKSSVASWLLGVPKTAVCYSRRNPWLSSGLISIQAAPISGCVNKDSQFPHQPNACYSSCFVELLEGFNKHTDIRPKPGAQSGTT